MLRIAVPNKGSLSEAALDILKERLGLDELVLAGQSGGSTLIASLLTRGRDALTQIRTR